MIRYSSSIIFTVPMRPLQASKKPTVAILFLVPPLKSSQGSEPQGSPGPVQPSAEIPFMLPSINLPLKSRCTQAHPAVACKRAKQSEWVTHQWEKSVRVYRVYNLQRRLFKNPLKSYPPTLLQHISVHDLPTRGTSPPLKCKPLTALWELFEWFLSKHH